MNVDLVILLIARWGDFQWQNILKAQRCQLTYEANTQKNAERETRKWHKAVPQKYISRCVGKIKKMQLWKSVKTRWEHIRGLSHLSSPHDTTRCSATHDSAVLAWTSLADRNVCVAACAQVPVCVRLPLMLPQGLSKSARWIMCSFCVSCVQLVYLHLCTTVKIPGNHVDVCLCVVLWTFLQKKRMHIWSMWHVSLAKSLLNKGFIAILNFEL